MRKQFIKIISLIFAILFLLVTPLGSYVNSKYSSVYAFENIIDDNIMKYALPVAAYMALQYENTLKGMENAVITVQAVASKIDELTSNSAAVLSQIPAKSKAIIAKLYTNLTTEQINQALGTTYTEADINSFASRLMNRYQTGTIGSTYQDIYDMGIAHLFANSVKSLNSNSNLDVGVLIGKLIANGETFYNKSLVSSNGNVGVYTFRNKPFANEFWTLFGRVFYTNSISMNYLNRERLHCNANYTFSYLGNIYSIQIKGDSYNVYGTDNSSYVAGIGRSVIDNSYLSENTTSKIYFHKLVDGSFSRIMTVSYYTSDYTMSRFLTDLKQTVGLDLTGTSFNTESNFNEVFTLTYIGNTVLNPTGAFSTSLAIPALDSGFWTGEDVSATPAERVTGAAGISSATWDVEVGTNTKANDDPDTNTDLPYVTDVVLSPTTEIDVPKVDTANPDNNIGNPDDTGGILNWLKGFWDLLKALWEKLWGFLASIVALLTSIFTNTGNLSESAEGVDWGNFKGFFDIFYIFYYLIILVIIILIKFFAVIVSILSIPANAELFNQYPMLLSGLNYIKTIKVGGFNITLWQIFEYMFTVFFFLYIVTQLQKLYHSFSGIERQQVKINEREQRLALYEDAKHYSPTNYYKDISKISSGAPKVNEDIYENIKFTDYSEGD